MGAYLTDEEMSSLQGLPALDAQQASLQKQLEFARALMSSRPQERRSTGLGALFSGIGDIARTAGGALQQRDLQGKLDAVLGRRAAGEGAGAKLRALREQQAMKAGEQDLAAGAQRMGLEKQEGEAKASARARMLDPAGARAGMGADLLRRLGMKPPEGATPEDIEAILPGAGRADESEQRAKDRALTRQAIAARAKDMGVDLSPDALDMLARQVLSTGQMPAMGVGKAGSALKAAIVERAAAMRPEADLAQAKAGFGADSASLRKLQTQADAVNAFERTALANLDAFLGEAKKVVDVGSPWFNKPARELARGLAGSPNAAAFEASRQVAVQEIAKVLSGAMGNAAVSDSARHEAAALLSPDASLAQIERAAQILKQDMHNRKVAYAAELGDVRARVGGSGTPTPATGAPAGGLTPEKQRRLEELRAKRDVGALR